MKKYSVLKGVLSFIFIMDGGKFKLYFVGFIFRIFLFMFVIKVITSFIKMLGKTAANNEQKKYTRTEYQKGTNHSTTQGTENKPVIQMVKDELCGAHIQKEKAYIVVDNDTKTHYFCSLDCRQKYINKEKM